MSNQISTLRKITVYNTSAQNNREIQTSALTWGDLQVELDRIGIPYSGMRAVIGENQNEMITPQSQLMEGDMTLFLMPRKVKSGGDLDHLVIPGGLRHFEIDWNDPDNVIERSKFRTKFDLIMALQRRAIYYMELASDHLDDLEHNIDYDDDDKEITEVEIEAEEGDDWPFDSAGPIDPEKERLQRMAREIQQRMDG
jgi:hypothetical protein